MRDYTRPAAGCGGALTVLALLVAAGCGSNPAALTEAVEACTARGLDPATPVFDACVSEVENEIYVRWGRDRISKGD